MAGDDITFSGWIALIALVLTGIGWAGGWAFARGRNAQSTDDQGGQIGRMQEALDEKERRVDALGERVARIEARVDHLSDSIKRADTALVRLAEKMEALSK